MQDESEETLWYDTEDDELKKLVARLRSSQARDAQLDPVYRFVTHLKVMAAIITIAALLIFLGDVGTYVTTAVLGLAGATMVVIVFNGWRTEGLKLKIRSRAAMWITDAEYRLLQEQLQFYTGNPYLGLLAVCKAYPECNSLIATYLANTVTDRAVARDKCGKEQEFAQRRITLHADPVARKIRDMIS